MRKRERARVGFVVVMAEVEEKEGEDERYKEARKDETMKVERSHIKEVRKEQDEGGW